MSGHWLARRTGLVTTAPPPTRLSARSVLDEDTRPPAPEPSADVTYRQPRLTVGQHLIDVLDHYRAELNRLTIRANERTRSYPTSPPRNANSSARWPSTASTRVSCGLSRLLSEHGG